MRTALLGPVRVYDGDGVPAAIGGTRPRALLARLALAAGDTVPAAELIDALWGAHPPANALNSLHALVYRLRKNLPEGRLLESAPAGYRLALPRERVDALCFADLASRAARALADAPQEASALLGEALALWEGPALADVRDAYFADAAAVWWENARAQAQADHWEAELRLGRGASILPDLEAASTLDPLRERLAALRVRALYAAGRQSDALAVFDDVRRRLAEELGVDPSPVLREAHLAVVRGETADPPTAPDPVAARLPTRLTSFVGREAELALLGNLLTTSRLVTAVGPGGVGKTRLALEAAAAHRSYRQGRAWFVPLAGARDRAGLLDAVLGALGGPRGRPVVAADPLDRVAALLGGDEALLVLDNCEQLTDAAAEFTQGILERRPRLTVLATSREPLDVLGESLCRLAPLPLPEPAAGPRESAAAPAVRLFLDRAGAARPGFACDATTVRAVGDVVRGLDGVPLALELAAARLRSMSVEQIARRLDDRFRLLSSGNRAGPPRQRTLHAVIGWSWDLLDHQERLLMRRLAVFPASAEAAAVEAVCADDDALPAADVPYVLGALVDKSLVERAGDRWRMLASVRAYAAEQLDAAGERAAAETRLVRHFAELAARHEPLLRSAGQEASYGLFTVEYDNLVHALRTAVGRRDADAAARLLSPLSWYWHALRWDARADALVASVCALGEALPPDARAAFTALRVLTGSDAPDADRVRAVVEDCARTGALERCPTALLPTLSAAHLLGLDALVTRLTRDIRERDDHWATGCTYLAEALAHHENGDWTALAGATASALRAFEASGDRLCTAMALAGTARVHSVRGEHDAAIAAYGRGLALAPQDAVSYRLGLAAERMRGGDPAGARHDLDAADRAARQRGDALLRVGVLACRSELHRRSGEPAAAEAELGRLEALAAASSLPAEEVAHWVAPVRMANLLAAGDAVRAREALPGAVRAAFAHRNTALAAQQVAALLLAEGDAPGAAAALGTSRAIRGAFDDGDPELRGLAAALVRRLGEDAYATAFAEGAAVPRARALDRLREAAR
ncbi:BTAD domain-containing putative transcriptional regulator [Streptomyces cremeus]|uniref:BTAD domain-containing putative transcriptional regulator n=1 Tax=Streptomyces cremeus TaxID=66881 RepID=A0ABV5PIG7_STRCM